MDMNTRILLTINFKISLTCDVIMLMAVLKIVLHTNVIDVLNIGADFVESSRQDKINREQMIKEYDNFKELHDKEIERLKELKLNGYRFLSSMGI